MTRRPANSSAKLASMLNSVGFRPSVQRMAVLEYLMTHKTHPTVDEIYHDLVESMPSLSRTTIYNTVWSLAQSGLIDTLDIDRNNTRFDYAPQPHAHFRCKECGRIFDITLPDSELPELLEGTVERVEINYKGLCRMCSLSH